MADKIAPYWPLQDPFDSHIVFADGTEIDGEGSKSSIEDELWLWPKQKTIAEAAVLFSDPVKTQSISIRRNEDIITYQGYTALTDVKINWDGRLAVCMRKPRQVEMEEGIQNGV